MAAFEDAGPSMSPWYPVGWSALRDGHRHGAGVTHLGVLIHVGPLNSHGGC